MSGPFHMRSETTTIANGLTLFKQSECVECGTLSDTSSSSIYLFIYVEMIMLYMPR